MFNMTIVQVLTQKIERVTELESELKAKEQLIKQAEVDMNVIKEALKKKRKAVKKMKKLLMILKHHRRKKAVEETKLVEDLKSTKDLLSKAHEDLETKTSALNEKLDKVK